MIIDFTVFKFSLHQEFELEKFRDLATPTLLHFGNTQASLELRSTSAVPIIGEVRYCRKTTNSIKIKSNEVNNAKLRYEGYKKLSEM